jgi:hypothetical protein
MDCKGHGEHSYNASLVRLKELVLVSEEQFTSDGSDLELIYNM